jgi:hypothetical protein
MKHLNRSCHEKQQYKGAILRDDSSKIGNNRDAMKYKCR